MALFRRKKQDTTSVPQEVQDYYQAERRERVGMAWFLALAAFVLTILIAIALFFGGRFIWRKVFNNDQPAGPAQTTEPAPSGNKESNQADTTTNDNQEQGSTPQTLPSGNTDNTPATNQTPPTTPSTRPTTTPVTGPLPNTGPGDVAAIFVITTVAGTVAHRVIYRREV